MAELSVEISAKIEKLLSELKKAKNALKGFGEVGKEIKVKLKRVFSGIGEVINKLKIKIAQLTDKFKEAGEKMGRIGRSMTTYLTLPLVAFAAVAAKSFATFESELSKIEGLVGIAGDKVAEMGEKALVMASKFGKSGKEAAEALFFITSAGLRGKDAMEVLEASLKASVIGLGDTKTVADLATSAMNAYGVKALSAAQATDIMTAAVREGKLDATTLAGSMGRVLPIAAAMGVKFNEVGAAFAAMSRTGTKADEAATQLRGILSSLLNPASEAEKVLKELGLSSDGLRKNIADKGLLNTLEILTQKFEGNSEKAGLVFGNVRALSGVLDLMGKNVGETRNIFSKMNNTLGDTDKAFEVTAKTAGFRFSVALISLQNSFIELGNVISVVFLPIVEKVGLFLKKLSEKFSRLSPETKKTIVVITALVAAIGPLLIALGFLSTTIIPALITGFGILLGPIGLITAAIVALGVVVYKNFDAIIIKIAEFYNSFVDVYNQSKLLRGVIAAIGASFKNVWTQAKFAFKSIWSIMKGFGSSTMALFENIGKIISGALTFNSDKIEAGIFGAKNALKNNLYRVAGEVAKYAKDAGNEIAENLTEALDTTLNGHLEKKTPEQIKQSLSSLADSLKETAKKAGKAVGLEFAEGVDEGSSGVGGRKKATGINTEGLATGVSDVASATIQVPKIDTAPLVNNLQDVIDITPNVMGAFEGIGSAIGGALANGNDIMSALGSVLLSTIGDIAIKLGQSAIGIGVAMMAIKMSFTNPLTAIAAGIALVAIGSAIKGVAGAVSGGGGGSSSGAGASNFSGSSGGGNFGASSGGGMQNVVFEIQGTKLVGVLSNTLSRNRSLGGSLSIT